jgi:hypothetical protein
MKLDPTLADSPQNGPTYCSRSEAIELSMSVMLWSHAAVMVVALVTEILLFGPLGVWIGLAAVAGLLAIMPVIVLPSAYVIGWMAHRLFHPGTIRVEIAVRVFALLFEVNLLGWVLFASLALY